MPEEITSESFMHNLVDKISDGVSKHKSVSFLDDNSDSVQSQFSRLFGREKPVHHILGGGRSADVLLWRNKKISAGVLTGATITWVLFEWLNYHFLSLLCFALIIGLLIQFFWTKASGTFSSSSRVPRVTVPEDAFVNAGRLVGTEVNRSLYFLQEAACGGNIKQFLVVVGCLLGAAIIGSWCSFLTVIYIGFIGAHTLPVLYERYDNEVDGFVDSAFKQLKRSYNKLDDRVLSRIPKSAIRGKKFE